MNNTTVPLRLVNDRNVTDFPAIIPQEIHDKVAKQAMNARIYGYMREATDAFEEGNDDLARALRAEAQRLEAEMEKDT